MEPSLRVREPELLLMSDSCFFFVLLRFGVTRVAVALEPSLVSVFMTMLQAVARPL